MSFLFPLAILALVLCEKPVSSPCKVPEAMIDHLQAASPEICRIRSSNALPRSQPIASSKFIAEVTSNDRVKGIVYTDVDIVGNVVNAGGVA